MKALGAFNREKALGGAFSVIVKSSGISVISVKSVMCMTSDNVVTVPGEVVTTRDSPQLSVGGGG